MNDSSFLKNGYLTPESTNKKENKYLNVVRRSIPNKSALRKRSQKKRILNKDLLSAISFSCSDFTKNHK